MGGLRPVKVRSFTAIFVRPEAQPLSSGWDAPTQPGVKPEAASVVRPPPVASLRTDAAIPLNFFNRNPVASALLSGKRHS